MSANKQTWWSCLVWVTFISSNQVAHCSTPPVPPSTVMLLVQVGLSRLFLSKYSGSIVHQVRRVHVERMAASICRRRGQCKSWSQVGRRWHQHAKDKMYNHFRLILKNLFGIYTNTNTETKLTLCTKLAKILEKPLLDFNVCTHTANGAIWTTSGCRLVNSDIDGVRVFCRWLVSSMMSSMMNWIGVTSSISVPNNGVAKRGFF